MGEILKAKVNIQITNDEYTTIAILKDTSIAIDQFICFTEYKGTKGQFIEESVREKLDPFLDKLRKFRKLSMDL